MKKLLVILFFFFNNAYSKDIVYLDVQFIIDNSNIGKHYKKKVNLIQNEKGTKLKIKEKEIKDKETEINNKKNILNEDEIKKKNK